MLKRFIFFLALILSANPSLCQLQNASLKYLVRQSVVKTEKTPLLVLLHGRGGHEKELFSLADRIPPEFLVVSVRAPVEWGEGFAWFPVVIESGKRIIDFEKVEKSRQLFIDFLSELKKERSFDPEQVYLCGFSQGAIMSYAVGLTRLDLIKGIAVFGGMLLDEVKPLIANKEKPGALQIYIAHGTDDQVIGIEKARSSVAHLKYLGLNPVYTEYPAGHEMNKTMIADFLKWISQRH